MSLCQWVLGYNPWSHQKVINSRQGKSVYPSVKGHLRYHKVPEHYKAADALLNAVSALYTETLGPQLLLSIVFIHIHAAEIFKGPLHWILITLKIAFALCSPGFLATTMQAANRSLKKTYACRQGFLSSLCDHTIHGEQDQTKNRSKQNPHFWHEECRAWWISATWEFVSVKYCIMII